MDTTADLPHNMYMSPLHCKNEEDYHVPNVGSQNVLAFQAHT